MKSLLAQVVSVDPHTGEGSLRLTGGTLASFRFEAAMGFVPVPGLGVVAQLDADGGVLRIHLPAHPSKPEPLPSTDLSWVTVLLDGPLPEESGALQSLFEGLGAPRPRLVSYPATADGKRRLEIVWPLMHMLLIETRVPYPLETADRRALPPGFSAGTSSISLLPTAVDPAEERRLLGDAFSDPWGPDGTLRRASRAVRALLTAGGRGIVLHRAGHLALGQQDVLRRFGDLENSDVRPFGAWVDWALTEDRRSYRTLGMATLGGEDVEIAVKDPDAEVEVDSAESALLFACMLQVRENRFLADGELFHVPKDVRVGARGASANSKTGYRYFAHRGHDRVQLVRG